MENLEGIQLINIDLINSELEECQSKLNNLLLPSSKSDSITRIKLVTKIDILNKVLMNCKVVKKIILNENGYKI